MALIFILIITFSMFYTLYIQMFSTNAAKAKLLSDIFSKASLAALAVSIISLIAYYVSKSSADNELAGAVGDAFAVFAFPSLILAVFVVLLTLTVHFTGKKMSGAIPAVCHLASLLILLYTLIDASWSHYEEFPLHIYINLLGCSLSVAVLFSSALTMRQLAKKLEDKDYIYWRKHRHDEKHRKAEERKRIKETKKRIKNRTK